MIRPLAYISASWSDDELKTKADAAAYCRLVYEAGFSPICPVMFQPYFLSDKRAKEYKDGREMANELLRRSRILVVCSEVESDEMLEDIAIADHYHIAATTLDGIIAVGSNKARKKVSRKVSKKTEKKGGAACRKK